MTVKLYFNELSYNAIRAGFWQVMCRSPPKSSPAISRHYPTPFAERPYPEIPITLRRH